MVSLKQELSVLDYFGPLIVFVAFFAIVFVISATCILWFCVDDADGAVLSKVSHKRLPCNLEIASRVFAL